MIGTVLLLVISALPSFCAGGTAASVSCSSELTPPGGGVCVGVPVKCTVILNATACDDGGGSVAMLSASDLHLTIAQTATHTPAFAVNQTGVSVVVIADFSPTLDSSTVAVAISSTHPDCTFSAALTSVPVAPIVDCSYPISLSLSHNSSELTERVRGGDIITVSLNMTVTDPLLVEDVTVAYSLLHPSLKFLLADAVASDPGVNVTSPIVSPSDDHHGLLSTAFTPAAHLSSLSQDDVANMTLSFQVQSYVLPSSTLYISLHVFYHYSPFSTFSLQQSIDQLRGYQTSEVTFGNITVNLTHYDERDYEPYTFPSQEGDIFTVTIPVLIPCVSTDLTVSIVLPEFLSDLYTEYFMNITSVNITTPPNLMSIPHLCNYTDLEASMCAFNELNGTGPVVITSIEYEEQTSNGTDDVTVTFGPLMYNMTADSSCIGNDPPISCSCGDDELHIVLTVVSLTDMVCENQTLADNVTTTGMHTVENTFWPWPVVGLSHTEPIVSQYQVMISSLYPVNASTPAFSLSVSSYCGDAGDNFTVTVRIAHDGEYSKFTAYNMNYTFSIDPHLIPAENITICFSDECEDVPFVNLTIVREGYHEVFTLHTHVVELALNVTIVQDVPPGATYNNDVSNIFQALPDDNVLNITPLVCSNSSSGSVGIKPVIVHPWVVHWSNVDSSATEDFPSTLTEHHVSLDEQFNTTVLTCMPECVTGVNFYVLLPTDRGLPVLTVDDAYVTFVGSELMNLTLSVGDSLHSSENITVVSSGTTVRFFFGPEVVAPILTLSNLTSGTELCFEVGLLFTVSNSFVTHRDRFEYTAYAETDFGVRSNSQDNNLLIVEPTLRTSSTAFLGTRDAGDIVTSVITIQHSSSTPLIHGYRLNLTVTYPIEFLYLNESDISSTVLLLNENIQLYSVTVNSTAGEIVFSADELGATDVLEATAVFRLTNNVRNAQRYRIDHVLDWHNLPYELPAEGRYYTTGRDQSVFIANSQLMLDYTTSNKHTPNEFLQLQEHVYLNLTILLPEGVSAMTVRLSHINLMPESGDYPFNFTYGEVLRIGSSISNASLTVKDNSTANPLSIDISEVSATITFFLGDNVVNTYDNIVNEEDEILLYIEGYISNNGSSVADQLIILLAQDPNSAFAFVLLQLVHPQLQIESGVVSSGPWDAGDLVHITVLVNMTAISTGYAAYELIVGVELDSGALTNDLIILNATSVSGGPLCSVDVSKISTYQLNISSLRLNCTAELQIGVTLSELEVVAGDNITVVIILSEYYAVTLEDALLTRVNYGPISDSLTVFIKTPSQVFLKNTSHPLNYVPPFQSIQLTYTLTVPEGQTRGVYVFFNITVTPPGDPATVSLSLSLESSEIHPTSNHTSLPFLGDLFNPADNTLTANDTVEFVLFLDVPDASGTPFNVAAIMTYSTSSGEQRLVDVLDFVIVRPDINISTSALSVRFSRVVFTETIRFDLQIERSDGTFPTYDILADITLELPPQTVLNVSLNELSVSSVVRNSTGTWLSLNRSVLSYVNGLSVQLFQFEGYFLPNVTDEQVFRITGSVSYATDPFTNSNYVELITFPELYFLKPRIIAGSLQFDSLFVDGSGSDIVVWRLTFSDVAGPPNDLTVDVQVNTETLILQSVRVQSIGSRFYQLPLLVVNTSSQAQLVFQNLSLSESPRVCLNCSMEAALLVYTELVGEVSEHGVLVNATGHYFSETAMVEARNSLIEMNYITNVIDTAEGIIQVGEIVKLNITISPPENVTIHSTMTVTASQSSPLDYPVILSAVDVLLIGANINSSLLSVGDSSSSPHISLSDNVVSVELGEVLNSGDGVIDEGDLVVVRVTAYALGTGTGLGNQTVVFRCFLEEEAFVRDTVSLELVHPQLELSLTGVTPPGPWDARDLISLTFSLSHQDPSHAATAYDLQFSFATNEGSFESLAIASANTSGVSCLVEMLSCSVSSVVLLVCDSLPAGCDASLTVRAEPPLTVTAGGNITIETTLHYDSYPFSSPHPGVTYRPITSDFTEALAVATLTLQLSTRHPLVNTTLYFTVAILFADGVTRNVSTTIEAQDTNQTLSVNFTLESISVGDYINMSSAELLNSYPTFGDIAVIGENDSLAEPYTLTITYSTLIPEQALLTNFTVLAEITYSTLENVLLYATDTDSWLVVTEPNLNVELSVSDRLVDVGFSVLYNVTLVYSYQLDLGGRASIRTAGFLPSFLSVGSSSLINETSQYTDMEGREFTEVSFVDFEINALLAIRQFSLNVSVTPNATNRTVILTTVASELAYSLILGVFRMATDFPDVFLPHLSLTVVLVSSRYSFTEGSIVTFGEVTTWRVLLSTVVGPAQNLTVTVSSSYEHLGLIGLRVLAIGSSLTMTGVPVAEMVDEAAVFVFPDLTLTNPTGYNGTEASCDCNIVAEVDFIPLEAMTENELVSLGADSTYGSLQQRDFDIIIITPLANLTLDVTLEPESEEEVQGGTSVSVTATVRHTSIQPLDTYDLVVTFPDKDSQLNVSPNATASFSNGNITIFSSKVLFDNGGGFNISLLPWNETVEISLLYTFVPLTTLGRVVTFTAVVEYSNTNTSTPGFRNRARGQEDLMLRSLGDLQRELVTTSCSYTVGNQLAINEIFEVAALKHIRHGVSSPVYHAIVSTDNGAPLPLSLLNVRGSLPNATTFQINSTNASNIDVQYFTPSELHIIWNLGEVRNFPDGQVNDNDLTELVYTFAVLENSSSINILVRNLAISLQSNETEVTLDLTLSIVQPELMTMFDIEVLEEGNPRITRFTVTIHHSLNSTAPAFFLNITDYVPLDFSLLSQANVMYTEEDTVREMSVNAVNNRIEVENLVLALGLDVTVTFLAQMNISLPDGANATNTVELQYSTVEQEGIGLSYPEYNGREQSHSSQMCVRKDITELTELTSDFYWLLIWLIIGIVVGVVLSALALAVYHCFIYIRVQQKERRVIPALLFGMIQEEEYSVFKSGGKRALFSSLLKALPKDKWFDSEDTYAGAESDYIAEVEGDLFHFEVHAINRLLLHVLQTNTNLKPEKIQKAKTEFNFKVDELRSNLKQSMGNEMQKAAFQSVADKMTKMEDLSTAQSESVAQLQSTLTLTINLAAAEDLLEHLNRENELEVLELASVNGLEKKEAELVISQQYMAHYILGVKAIMLQVLQKFCPKNVDASTLMEDLSGELGLAVLSEESAQEESSVTRGKRQRECLLEKKLVEEEDIYWEIQMLKLIDNSLSSIKRSYILKEEDVSALHKEVTDSFHTKMEQLRSHKREQELEINGRAESELRRREEQLAVFRFEDSIGKVFSVTLEIERWHSVQSEREETLREVEKQAIRELTECWGRHRKARNQLLEEQTTKLTEHMLSKGVQLQVCDAILRQHAKKRLKVKEKIEASSLIQRAKFQALVERQRQRVKEVIETNLQLHSNRMEVERHFLHDITSGVCGEEHLDKIEQYHKDIAALQRSMALEILRVHLRTKARVSVLKKRKFQTALTKCLHALQSTETSDSPLNVKETIDSLIKQRKKVELERYTKMFEEERKRIEENYTQEREREIAQVMDTSIELVLSEEEEVFEEIATSPPNSERTLQFDLSNVQEETKKLLIDHRENLLSINSKLEAEKQNIARTFEKKLERRRLQRVKAVMELTAPVCETNSQPIVKPMRFVAAVRKVMLSVRMQSIREQHKEELASAFEELHKSYDLKRHDAFSKLGRKLESRLLQVRKLPREELIQIFQNVDSWQAELEKPQKGRYRSNSVNPPYPISGRLTRQDALCMRRLTCPEL